jgi:hypothetical protein
MTPSRLLPALLLLAANPALAQEREAIPVEAGQYPAKELVARWASSNGKLLSVGPNAEEVRLELPTRADLTRASLRAVLDARDLVLLDGAGETLRLVHRRNLPNHVSPPHRIVEGEIPDTDEVITAVLRVRHGGGAQVFATLRGLLASDSNRIGNVLYLPETETILVVDFAHKARYYKRVAELLDRPAGATAVALRLYELPRKAWLELREQGRDQELWQTLARFEQAGDALLLEEADLTLQGEDFSVSRDVSLAGGDSAGISLGVLRGSEGDEQLHLQLQVVFRGRQQASRSIRLPLPKDLGARDGLWVQAVAGRELDAPSQFVLLLRPVR